MITAYLYRSLGKNVNILLALPPNFEEFGQKRDLKELDSKNAPLEGWSNQAASGGRVSRDLRRSSIEKAPHRGDAAPGGESLPRLRKNSDRKSSQTLKMYCIRLLRALYGLKQSGWMWHHRLCDYLKSKGFKHDEQCPFIFIRKTPNGFVIITAYVDDLDIFATDHDTARFAAEALQKEFDMKDLGETAHCLGLQIEHIAPNQHHRGGVLVHQATYTKRMLKKFRMEDAYPVSTPMIGRKLDIERDPLGPKKDDEETLLEGTPYLSAIGALLYLSGCTRPDIAFAINLLARHSSAPTKRHWNAVKHLFRYLRGTQDLCLFYQCPTGKESNTGLVGYADAGFNSEPYTGRSQTGFVFLHNGTAISWKSTTQTMATTSSAHAELLALHEASRECVCLRSMM